MRSALLISPRVNVIEDAYKAGYKKVFVFLKKGQVTSEIMELVDEVFVFDWDNYSIAERLAETLNKLCPIYRVYGFGEYSVHLAAYLTASLGLKGVSCQSVEISTDKYLMRKIFNNNPALKVQSDILDQEKLDMDTLLYPLIVKPKCGTGSMDIFKINDSNEFKNFLNNKEDMDNFIVEEFLEGKEISVEAISYEGSHHIIGFTEKFTSGSPNFIESGHIFPYKVEKTLEKQIIDYIRLVLDSIHYKTGLSHTELILTKNGPKVIETHVRPGGDRISDLIELSTGISAFYALFYFDLYGIRTFEDSTLVKNYASAQFLSFDEGTVKKVNGMEAVKENNNVQEVFLNFGEGDDLLIPTSSQTRHGFFVAATTERNNLEKLIEDIKKTISIEYE